MAKFDSYTQVGQAEDVQDAIYNISPVDSPVVSMSRNIQATGKLHEWHQDVLRAAASNKHVEGADAPPDSSQAAINKSNYCQIMTKVAEVAGTLETVDKYGRDSEVAYQLELRYGEIANDEEHAVMGAPGGTRQTGAAGDGSTAREMSSFFSQLDNTVTADGAAYTTVVQLEDGILDAHQASYTAGGNPGYLLVDPTRARHISKFARAAGRQRDIRNEKRLVSVIDLLVNDYGELDVILDRNMDDQVAGIDFNYTASAILRSTTDWELAKIGDSIRRQVLREGTFAVLNDKAHFSVDNVPASLSLS